MALRLSVTALVLAALFHAIPVVAQTSIVTNTAAFNLPKVLQLATNRSLVMPGTSGQNPGRSWQSAVPNKAASDMPKPGVYKTAPYACIVIVPCAHPDDKSVIRAGGDHFRMPVVRPGLKFIPVPSK